MKILCAGDSWTKGYGVPLGSAWPEVLESAGHDITNTGKSGSTNDEIVESIKDSILHDQYDVVIVGWSGVTRYHYNEVKIDFSYSVDLRLRDDFFRNYKTLADIEKDFIDQNQRVNTLCEASGTKLIKFSVFGDLAHLWDDNFVEYSCLEYLANKQNIFFKYDVPFFEFDYLVKENLKNTTRFAKKYFSKDWKKAIVEREIERPSENFLMCGHPNINGHIRWAEYIKDYL